jgi:1-deoxy-D-xylulose-5-phosphate reductoisomerase
MKKIVILGSTGSIGTQTLDVVRNLKGDFKVIGLSAFNNVDLLTKQVEEFKPRHVVVGNGKSLIQKEYLGRVNVLDNIKDLVSLGDVELVVNAISGSAGIVPTIETIKAGKDIALANKESLVAAGEIVIDLAEKNNVEIFPVDSEHSAIWQCLQGEDKESIKKLILTCSGGPFRGKTKKDLENVTVKNALNHPTWKMGGKITIDSATLMNKGFEVIAAYYIFGVSAERIEVLIHPESMVHSLVEFCDGSIKAQVGPCDMKIPIQYALTYPERKKTPSRKFSLAKIRTLNFEKPDLNTFPCLSYAYGALKIGGTMPAVLNAANESAVDLFLDNKIKFLDIPKMIKRALASHEVIENPNFEQIIEVENRVRDFFCKLSK